MNPRSNLADFYKALTPTYLSEAYEKMYAESMAINSDIPKLVNPATLLTITMLEGALLLRKFGESTSTLRGWEKEAIAYLSGVSIYGPVAVNPSSSPKANSTP